jgi:hypothetical protein
MLVCEAIGQRLLLEFDYNGSRRLVQPYCHGVSTTGQESLRAIQVGGSPGSKLISSGKLWTVAKMSNLKLSAQTFKPNDPHYNPQDSAMQSIHCRI